MSPALAIPTLCPGSHTCTQSGTCRISWSTDPAALPTWLGVVDAATGCFAPLCPKLPLSPEIPWSPSLQSSVLAKCLLWRAEYCSCCQCLMFIGHRLWICAYICIWFTVFTPFVTGFTCWFGCHDLQGIRSQGSPKFSCCLWSLVLLSCVGGSKEEARVRVPGLRTGPKPPFFVI